VDLIVLAKVISQINEAICFLRALNCVCFLPQFSGATGQ